jgi:hypothetical protein
MMGSNATAGGTARFVFGCGNAALTGATAKISASGIWAALDPGPPGVVSNYPHTRSGAHVD